MRGNCARRTVRQAYGAVLSPRKTEGEPGSTSSAPGHGRSGSLIQSRISRTKGSSEGAFRHVSEGMNRRDSPKALSAEQIL